MYVRCQILDMTLPVVPWDSEATAQHPAEGLTVTWIGHSTVLVQMDNITILTDPVFSGCCSPVRLPGVGVRYRPAACTVDQLPRIDAVVISHNHFDHLDHRSVVQLNQRFGADLCWFVPSGLQSWMHSAGCQHVVELSWWKEHEFSADVKFACVPSQHWSKRGVWDDNKVTVSAILLTTRNCPMYFLYWVIDMLGDLLFWRLKNVKSSRPAHYHMIDTVNMLPGVSLGTQGQHNYLIDELMRTSLTY